MVSVRSVARIVAFTALGIAAAVICPSMPNAQMVPTRVAQTAPGQAVVSIEPAATVLSTTHYQAMVGLSCSSHTCSGNFPQPGTKRQINVTRVSCTILSNANSIFGYGRAQLYNSASTLLLSQELVNVHTNPGGSHATNDAVDILVAGSQHLSVFLFIANDVANGALCSISGTLNVLG